MRFLSVLLFFAFSLLFYQCSDSDDLSIIQEVKIPSEVLLTYTSDSNSCNLMTIACPMETICNENFNYRALSFEDDQFSLYLSFDSQIVGTNELGNLKENFNYATFIIKYPQLETSNSIFHSFNRREGLNLKQRYITALRI